MKSRISFFDWATFKKDVTRFRPLWMLYTVLMLITILPMLDTSGWSHPARLLDDTLQVMAFLNLVYAAIAASLLFGELFNSRLCNALHAMPVTREARFGSHVIAGLAFSFIPNFLIAMLAIPALEHLWFVAFLWLSVICLQYVFFFGIGALSAMCTGSRFAMIMVYGLINLLTPLLYWFIDTVFQPGLPGVIISEEPFVLFSPIVQLMQNGDYSRLSWATPGIPMNFEECTFTGLGEDWPYLGIVALAGVGALVAALLLYRRRNLESAGDFIAVRWLSPVFLALYTLGFGAFFSAFGNLFGMVFDLLLVIGLFIGFFTGKMLLERTTKVFRKKNFLHAGIYAAVLLAAVLTVKADLFGDRKSVV